MSQRIVRSLAALLITVAACGDNGTPATSTITDSLGVAIVTNTALPPAGRRLWLDSIPAIDIGGQADDKRYDLLDIADALRLGDGRLVVMANGSSDLRFYDSSGRHLLTVGRKGDGPGEFRGVGHLYHGGGDTVYAYDYQLRRLTTIAPDGHLGPFLSVVAVDGFASVEPIGRLVDGSWIGVSTAFIAHPSISVQRDTMGVVHLSAHLDSITNVIARVPGTDQYVMTHGTGTRQTLQSMAVPFGLETQVAARGTTIWIGDAARYEVNAYRPDGKLTRIIRSTARRRAVTPSDVDRAKAAELAAAGSRSADVIERRWQAVPVPQQHPAFRMMAVDAAGRLWLGASKVVATDSTATTIFDSPGRAVGTLMLPSHFTPTEVGADYVLGVWTDANDLEHLRLYRLHGL